jgi:hypothetical protein|tara:strand:+ start:290 stop:484 length:195 start_codon:yes stop_codon:yes gene_type:complete
MIENKCGVCGKDFGVHDKYNGVWQVGFKCRVKVLKPVNFALVTETSFKKLVENHEAEELKGLSD